MKFVCLYFFLLVQYSLQIPLPDGEKEDSESHKEVSGIQTTENGSLSTTEASNETDVLVIQKLEIEFLLSAEEPNGSVSVDNSTWEKACNLFDIIKDELPEDHQSCNASSISNFKEEPEDDCSSIFFVARLECMDGVNRQCDLQVFFSPLSNSTSLSNSTCFSVSH